MTINLLTRSRLIEQNPRRHVEVFHNQTGLTVNVHAIDHGALYDEMISDFKQGSPFYDAFIFGPSWLSDFVDCQTTRGCPQPYLEDLTDRIRESTEIVWSDVNAFFRTFSSLYNGKVYTVPFDGDMLFLYVRTDVLDADNITYPQSWDEVFAIAEKYHGRDLNGDGEGDFGFCIHRKPKELAANLFLSLATPMLQSRGTKHGAFFDPETMDPLVNTPAFARALEIYRRLQTWAPPDETELSLGDVRELLLGGRCIFIIDWGDILGLANGTAWRADILPLRVPGSASVWDRQAKKLVTCNPDLCPYADPLTNLNFADYASFGGWCGGVSSLIPADRRAAAFDFLAFLSAPDQSNVDVVSGNGFEMYRRNQMTKQFLLDNGFAAAIAEKMPVQVYSALNSANVVIDLRLPQGALYLQAVDDALSRFNLGVADVATTMSDIESHWIRLVQKSDPRTVHNIYRKSIGLAPLDWRTEVTVPTGARVAVYVLSSVSLAMAMAFGVLIFLLRQKMVIKAASPFFCYLVILGGVLMFISMVIYALPVSDTLCNVVPWLLNTGFVMLFGNLVTKNYRIAKILSSSNRMESTGISNRALLPGTILQLALNFVVLITWTAFDPMVIEQTGDGVANSEYVYVCTSRKYNSWVGTLVILDFTILLLGCFLSFQTRHVHIWAFNESRHIAVSTYNFSVVAAIIVPVQILVKDPLPRFIIVAILILFATTFALCCIFIPKFIAAKSDGELTTPSVHGSANRSVQGSASGGVPRCGQCGNHCSFCAGKYSAQSSS